MIHHVYFLAVPLSIAALVATIVSYRKLSNPLEAEKPLSDVIRRLLDEVTEDTSRDRIVVEHRREVLPMRDAWSLYSNSRRNLVRAHRLLLEDDTREMNTWLKRAEETHSSLTKTLLFSQLENVVGGVLKMPFPLYTRASLGLFADEDWIITEMMQRRLELLQARLEGAQ